MGHFGWPNVVFYIVTTIVIIGILFYLHTEAKGNKLFSVSLALLLGGAIGNFIDRIFRKEVVDFIDTYIGSYDFPIFNIADSSLTIGVIFVMISIILDERKKKEL